MSDVGASTDESSEQKPPREKRPGSRNTFEQAAQQYIRDIKEKVDAAFKVPLGGNGIQEIRDAAISRIIATLEAAKGLKEITGVTGANLDEISKLFETARLAAVQHYTAAREDTLPYVVQRELERIMLSDTTTENRPGEDMYIKAPMDYARNISEGQFMIAAEVAAERLIQVINQELRNLQALDSTRGPSSEMTEAPQTINKQQSRGNDLIITWSRNDDIWLKVREGTGGIDEMPGSLENSITEVRSELTSVANEITTLITTLQEASTTIDRGGPLKDIATGIDATRLVAEKTLTWARDNSALVESVSSTLETSKLLPACLGAVYQQALSLAGRIQEDWRQIYRLNKSIEEQQIGTNQERSQIKEVAVAMNELKSCFRQLADKTDLALGVVNNI